MPRKPASRKRLSRTPPSRHTLKLLGAPIIFLIICSNLANIFWARLHENSPLLLIALSAINRYLILVADQLDPISYYGVGAARLLVSDPLFFLLGYWYGDRALAWMDRRSKTYGPLLREGQKWFGKAAWLLVIVAPNNFVCLFAGAAGMRVSLFYALNIVGTVGRLYLIRVLGDQFSSPIDSFRDFVGQYQIWFILGSFVLVAFSLRNEFRPGGEINDLAHLDNTLADGAGDDGGGPPSTDGSRIER